jgi:hypothetical protein
MANQNPETGTPWSRAELLEAFDMVADKKAWKNPIDRLVTREWFAYNGNRLREAIIFYTGSVPMFTPADDLHIRVEADGYYKTIGI